MTWNCRVVQTQELTHLKGPLHLQTHNAGLQQASVNLPLARPADFDNNKTFSDYSKK